MRIWLARARASILWLRDRSGAVDVFEDVVPVAVTMGGESTHQRQTIKEKRPIHLYLNLRSRCIEVGGWSRARLQGFWAPFRGRRTLAAKGPQRQPATALERPSTARENAAQAPAAACRPLAILAPAAGSRKLSVPTATSVAPTSSSSRASQALRTPPMPTTGIRTRAATAATCASATTRTAGPESPPVPPPSHGGRRAEAPCGAGWPRGASAVARSVLISDTA